MFSQLIINGASRIRKGHLCKEMTLSLGISFFLSAYGTTFEKRFTSINWLKINLNGAFCSIQFTVTAWFYDYCYVALSQWFHRLLQQKECRHINQTLTKMGVWQADVGFAFFMNMTNFLNFLYMRNIYQMHLFLVEYFHFPNNNHDSITVKLIELDICMDDHRLPEPEPFSGKK